MLNKDNNIEQLEALVTEIEDTSLLDMCIDLYDCDGSTYSAIIKGQPV